MRSQEPKAIVIDDHPLYRGALADMARSIFGDASVAEAADAKSGFRLAAGLEPLKCIFLDFRLPSLNGAEAVHLFRARWPDALLIVVSASEDRRERDAAVRAGADAFLSKGSTIEELTEAVHSLLRGGVLRPRLSAGERAGAASTGELGLTSRQVEVLALLSQGRTNKEIAARLGVSEVTVKTHVSAVFRALGVVNRTQAVLAARTLGFSPNS